MPMFWAALLLAALSPATLRQGSHHVAAPTKPASVGVVLSPADVAEVQRTVVAAPWTAARAMPPSCPIVYIVFAYNCPYCHAFIRESMVPMYKAGIDMRIIFAPVTGFSRDVAAEVALHRDFTTLMRAQMGQSVNAPDMQSSNDRIDAFNGLVYATKTVSTIAHRAGFAGYTPGFVWQDRTGQWRILGGYSAASTMAIRASLPQAGPACLPT